MPKNRIIYNSQSLYVSQVHSTGMQLSNDDIKQLSRIQNFDTEISRNYIDINELGNLSYITNIENKNPEIKANFSYFLTNGENEKYLGLIVNPSGDSFDIFTNKTPSCFSGFLIRSGDEKNYYLFVNEKGNDTININPNDGTVIGIGNGFITSYSMRAAIGELPIAEVEIEGSNICTYKDPDLVNWGSLQTLSIGGYYGVSVSSDKNSDLIVVGSDANSVDQFIYANIYKYSESLNEWSPYQFLGGYAGLSIGGYWNLGRSIAINNDGNTIVAGGFSIFNNTGAIAIFTGNNSNQWILKNSFTGIGGYWGNSVAINNSGNIIVVGAPLLNSNTGVITIFTGNRNLGWRVRSNISGNSSQGFFGQSVAINGSGNIIVIGSPGSNLNSGQISVLEGSPEIGWTTKQTLSGTLPIADRRIGESVAINDDANIIVAGSPGVNFPNITGTVDIYTRNNSLNPWQIKQTLSGNSLQDLFGSSVSVNGTGNIIAVGSSANDDSASNAGGGFIYEGNLNDGWVFKKSILGDSTQEFYGISISTAKNKNTVILGSRDADIPPNTNGAIKIASAQSGFKNPAININNGGLSKTFFNLPESSSLTGTNIPTALLPGDIILNIPTNAIPGFVETDLKIQEFSLTINIPRVPFNKLGNPFSSFLGPNYPINGRLEINAEIGDISDTNLINTICEESEKEFSIILKEPGCATNKKTVIAYTVRGAKLVSKNLSNDLGNNTTINATYEIPLNTSDSTKGLFIFSGDYNNVPIFICESPLGNSPYLLGTTNPGGEIFSKNSGIFTYIQPGASGNAFLPTGQYWNTGIIFNQSTQYALRLNPNMPFIQNATNEGGPSISTTLGTFTSVTNSNIQFPTGFFFNTGTVFNQQIPFIVQPSWQNFVNIVTGWSPNTGYISLPSNSFVLIQRVGSFGGFPYHWFSSDRSPNELTISEKQNWTGSLRRFTLYAVTGGIPVSTGIGGPLLSGWSAAAALDTPRSRTGVLFGHIPEGDTFLYFSGNSNGGGFPSISVRVFQTIRPPITGNLFDGFSNDLVTNWLPNTGYIEFPNEGAFVVINRTGNIGGYLNWYSSVKPSNEISIEDKRNWTGDLQSFSLYGMTGIGGYTNWALENPSQTTALDIDDKFAFGYLPRNHRFLYLRYASPGFRAPFATVQGYGGYYNTDTEIQKTPCPEITS